MEVGDGDGTQREADEKRDGMADGGNSLRRRAMRMHWAAAVEWKWYEN